MRKIGIDGNRPLDPSTGAINRTVDANLVAETGTSYVRLNFVLGPYDSPRHPEWQSRFDQIVNNLLAKDIAIYGLVSNESVRTSVGDNLRGSGPNGAADAWIAEYANNFDAIVERFQDRVKFFESFNEPNNWAGGHSALVHHYWMAKLLREVYQRVRIDNKRDVTLVSGPLLTHDLPPSGDNGVAYINGYFNDGKAHHGWNEFRSRYGTFPLDALGFHIYIENNPTPAESARAYKKRVDDVWNAFTSHEGANTAKRMCVSEFGWQSAHGEDNKAHHIDAVFPVLRDDWRIRLAILFCMQGWDNLTWGIYRPSGVSPNDREPAYEVFRKHAQQDRAQPSTTTQPGAAVTTQQKPAPPKAQAEWWQPILQRYFATNAQMKNFLGNSVPGGFLAQDGNRIEFFQNGGLIVRPNGDVTMAPIGAWIAEEYRRKGTPEFQWAQDRGGDNRYFDDTVHNLFGDFKAAWKGMYGKPVSEEFYLVLGGKAATCQMFEFAMMMHNPNTNQFELVQGRLSEIFLSMISGGPGLELIGRLVQRQPTRAVRALGEEPEVPLEGAPVEIPRMVEAPSAEVAVQPPAAAPISEIPAARMTLRSRADILASLEIVANALLSGAIDVETAESLVDICTTALEIL